MNTIPASLAALLVATAIPTVEAQTDTAGMRERAIANCKANRGVDCVTPAGLKEWIDAERQRPAGQRAPLMQRKLEAERRTAK